MRLRVLACSPAHTQLFAFCHRVQGRLHNPSILSKNGTTGSQHFVFLNFFEMRSLCAKCPARRRLTPNFQKIPKKTENSRKSRKKKRHPKIPKKDEKMPKHTKKPKSALKTGREPGKNRARTGHTLIRILSAFWWFSQFLGWALPFRVRFPSFSPKFLRCLLVGQKLVKYSG